MKHLDLDIPPASTSWPKLQLALYDALTASNTKARASRQNLKDVAQKTKSAELAELSRKRKATEDLIRGSGMYTVLHIA